MGQGKQRKLAGLAFGALISTGNQTIISRMEGMFVVLASVAIEIREKDQDEFLLYSFEPRDEQDDENSLEQARRTALKKCDPLFAQGSLIDHLKASIAQCELVAGPSFHLQVSIMDPEIVKQLQYIIS